MGLFSRKTNENKKSINWTELTSVAQLDDVITMSEEKPVMLFKHSTRCSISAMALNRVEGDWGFSEKEITPFYLDLIAHRDVSAAIADKFNVFHASPQMIVVKNGKSVLDASHNSINTRIIKEVI
ncbi:bacillithiol system redox-active protein YtxJ [Flavobacteriales bacterium]|nr:bacillithiol system redox-active protein YtxJ [Flavobacteriales bacterium]MDB4088464.1 bacillithiol system redox-active protein YtxJ [Flavobacteriales bacterium]